MTATLTVGQDTLLAAIGRHLTELDAKYGFAKRLARENNWSDQFAQTVVVEYAKFLFIAREGGHPVSPPPIIDKAWHLHLLHTEAYWSDLCPNILKMQLQHSPAEGAPGAQAVFANWSALTTASYKKFFGPLPPMWLPSFKTEKVFTVANVIGLAVIVGITIGVAIMFGQHFNVFTVIFLIVSFVIFLVITTALKAVVKPARRPGPSSCGSSYDSSSGSNSDSGHGGHGGHSCGGHGCGGH